MQFEAQINEHLVPRGVKMETKSMENWSERDPDGDLEQHRRQTSKKDSGGSLRVACGTPFWEPNGSQVGGQSRQNGGKMATEIV